MESFRFRNSPSRNFLKQIQFLLHVSNVLLGQMLSLLLRQKLKTKPARRSIILVQRSYKRYFYCHSNIRKMLQDLAENYGLTLEVFGDSPVPSLKQTAGKILWSISRSIFYFYLQTQNSTYECEFLLLLSTTFHSYFYFLHLLLLRQH